MSHFLQTNYKIKKIFRNYLYINIHMLITPYSFKCEKNTFKFILYHVFNEELLSFERLSKKRVRKWIRLTNFLLLVWNSQGSTRLYLGMFNICKE